MKRAGLAGFAILNFLILTPSALGQTQCEGGGQLTAASCGGDECSCAPKCTESSQCLSGCCSMGVCSLGCVCEGQGTLDLDCASNGGCGSVAPTALPAGGGASLWGFGLLGLGLIASGRFIRRSGLRSPAAVASVALTLLGATFVAVTAFEKAPIAPSKALVQR